MNQHYYPPRFTLLQAPAVEPITLADLKADQFLRSVNIDQEATLIQRLIVRAREIAEARCYRIMVQQWRATFDYAPAAYEFPRGNLRSVDEVRIIDEDGTPVVQPDSMYTVFLGMDGKMWLKQGETWSDNHREQAFFEIDYTIGWDTAAEVPETVINGMKKLITTAYYNRGEPDRLPKNLFYSERSLTL